MKVPVLHRSASGIATAITGGLWIALAAGYAGIWWWPLDLFAHFQVQYAALFLFCSLVLLSARWWRAAGAAVLGTTLCAAGILAQTGWPGSSATASPEPPRRSFRFVTFNAHFSNGELAPIAEYLQRMNADAIVLLELTREHADEIRRRMRQYPYVYASSPGRVYGALVLSRWPVIEAETLPLADAGARAARVRIAVRDRAVTIIGAHLHWPLSVGSARLRNSELMGLARLAEREEAPLLVGGDFNVTPWSAHFRRMLAASGLQDCARGQGWQPTWPSFLPPLRIRIDHCLTSRHWRVLEVRTGPSLGSDHLVAINDLELADGG